MITNPWAGETRDAVSSGINCRMMELQGRPGPGPACKKLDRRWWRSNVEKQGRLEGGPGPGSGGEHSAACLDEKGDSATFISLVPRDPRRRPGQAPGGPIGRSTARPRCIPWGVNTWHSLRPLGASARRAPPWPIKAAGPSSALTETAVLRRRTTCLRTNEILSRCLSWQIMLNWDEDETASR